MLTVKSRELLKMKDPYAVSWGATGEPATIYAASERRGGELYRLQIDGTEPEMISNHPGGCMGIIPLAPAGLSGILAIEDFFPIFKSEESGAAVYEPPIHSSDDWTRRRVLNIPFLHRLVLVPNSRSNRSELIAGQLCASKSSQDDWQSAGAIYRIVINTKHGLWHVDEIPLLDGLHRNHGLHTTTSGDVYVAADEGVFRLFRPTPNSDWASEQILGIPTSDLWMYDLDGDGEEEMATIHPFHGDTACLFKRVNNQWEQVWETCGNFGHVVWAGKIAGRSALLLGWREGSKTLDLHTLEDIKQWQFRTHTLARDVAPLNAVVRHFPSHDEILASFAMPGEVVLITLKDVIN